MPKVDISEVKKDELKPVSFDYIFEEKDIKFLLLHIFKKILNYCSGKVDFDTMFNFN